MSIRLKIFTGCLCLTALTVAVGLLGQTSQREIGDLAARLYDNSLLSTNSLRSAQTSLVKLGFEASRYAAEQGTAAVSSEEMEKVRTSLSAIEADLFLASAGSISDSGRGLVDQSRRRLAKLDLSDATTPRMLQREIGLAQDEIEAAVRVFAVDAYDVKGEVGQITHDSIAKTRWLVAIAAGLMVLVAWFLSRTIVPSIRRAAALARSIAQGDFSTKIGTKGSGEGEELLAAMANMQASLAERFDRFETTVASQASAMDAERIFQQGNLLTTIETLPQGLCIFDASGKVAVVNQRFIDMFAEGGIGIGSRLPALLTNPAFDGIFTRSNEPAIFTHRSRTGEVFSVTRRKAPDGGRIVTVDDVTESHLTEARLDHAATHDGMTGLFNRLALTQHIHIALQKRDAVGPTGLLLFDIDGFRSVNEAFGHPVGDALLKAVAGRLLGLVDSDDVVARIGGDEFAIARTGTGSVESMRSLGSAILVGLSQPFEIEGGSISVQVSIGISPSPEERSAPQSADGLILQAELALASARMAGRNRVRVFEPSMERESQLRRQTEIDLAKALERGEFELFYQPFVDVPMRAVSGFEALIRWRHPERGLVSPGHFIPIAEDSGIIAPIGLWVLETACQHAAHWPRGLTLSVNLSPVQFRNENLFDEIASIIRRTGFEPFRLQLEVTEGVFLQDSEHVMATLTALRGIGVRISMDDFGTGYSSLGYLSRFPFDKVKIDQSFVRDLVKRENLVIVRAIIGLSKAMGLSVMAEGVETRRQMETLLAENCVEMQGYHFAKPMPLSELPRFMMQFSLDRQSGRGFEDPYTLDAVS